MEINSIILSLSRNQGKYAAEDLLFCISGNGIKQVAIAKINNLYYRACDLLFSISLNGIKQVRAVVIIAAAHHFLSASIFLVNLPWTEKALETGPLTRPKLIKTPTKPLFGADVRFAPPSAY